MIYISSVTPHVYPGPCVQANASRFRSQKAFLADRLHQ